MNHKILLLIILCSLSKIVNAQAGKIKQLDSLFTNLYLSGEFNGNVLVAEQGKVLYEKSFGWQTKKLKKS